MAEADIDELFARTLLGDYDDDESWEAVNALRRIGTRAVFEKAVQWTDSADPKVRARGLDVIAQFGLAADHPFPQEAYDVALKAAQVEQEVSPLTSAIAALGHLWNPAAIPVIAAFHSHPEEDVRFTVACALGTFANDPRSVDSLLRLMEDADSEVRDWATFGLGVLGKQDSPDIRAALMRGLGDENEDVREEAMVGLAMRLDTRVLRPLIQALEQPGIAPRLTEAASALLGFETEPQGWLAPEYVRALRERFGSEEGTRTA